MDPIGKLAHPHSVKEARQIQREVGSLAILEDRFPRFPPQLVAGADAAYSRDGTRIHGAVAVLRYPELSPVEVQCAERPAEFPYVPGLFAFREGPVLRDAWTQLRTRPDLVIFHGHGTLHPEGCGLATHMGVLLDVPAIGVAGRPIGTEAVIPGPLRGDTAPVHVGERIAGCAVRTRAGAREVYVSPGHRISLETAVGIVLATATRYRMPEPLRAAHRHAVECRAMREKTGKSWKKSS
ncbi:MAG: endonuclease V [Methanomicrobiales archaeon]|nr:endonuclease V [Methanomicrobiales archaeon]